MLLISSVFLICCLCISKVYGSGFIEIEFEKCETKSINCTQIKITKQLNQLGELPTNLMQNYDIMETLNATNMNLSVIEPYTFDKAHHLHKVYMQHNQLTEIGKYSFVGARNLTVLNLGDNLIEILRPKCFWDLKKLIELNLQGNRLTILEKYLFVKNEKLELLDLSRNSIKQIAMEVFPEPNKIQMIDLQNNDCVNETFTEENMKQMTTKFDELNCTLKDEVEIDPINYSQRALIMWICIGLIMSIEIACLGMIYKKYKPPAKVEITLKRRRKQSVYTDVEN